MRNNLVVHKRVVHKRVVRQSVGQKAEATRPNYDVNFQIDWHRNFAASVARQPHA